MNKGIIKITEPGVKKERLFAQDEKLLKAVGDFASKINSSPIDPRYENTEPRALLVGGFVRDSLIGKFPKDADMEVYGVSPERLEELLDQLFPEKVNKVGKSFGILKVSPEEGIEFDVSIPRSESKTGIGHSGFTVNSDPSMNILEAGRRRDFTFNAVSFDPLSGEIFDPFGGTKDLENKILRVIDHGRFRDDPLRIYRAMQFVARMNLQVEEKSFDLMKQMVDNGALAELSKERITEELKKLLLKSQKPSVGFQLAKDLGIIEKYYPELNALTKTPQELEWHPEGDVWVHSMMVVDQAAKIIRQKDRQLTEEEKLEVMIGSLCHDLGKPSTTKVIDGKTRSLAHEEAGREIAKQLISRFSFGEHIATAGENMAAEHLKPGMLYTHLMKKELNEKQYSNAVRKLLKRIHPISYRVLIAVSESDFRGRGLQGVDTDKYLQGELFTKIITENKLDQEPTKPLIGGQDIIEIAKELGKDIRPGKIFKEIILEVEELRDEDIIETREQAIIELKKIINKF